MPVARSLLFVAGLAAAAIGPVQAGGGAVAEIELRPQVTVAERQVRLGDVAYLRTADLETIRRLAALPLGAAPQPGRHAVLDREVLARWIRARVGLRPEQLAWTGAAQAQVRGSVQLVTSGQIEQAARVALGEWLAARSSRFDVDVASPGRDLQLPAGRVALTARPLAAGAQPASRMVVWMDVAVDGAYVRTVPVTFSVDAYRDAWVASTEVAGGALLAPGMLELKEVEVTGRSALPVSAARPGALRASRDLQPGEPLSSRNATQVAAVERGGTVTLHFKAGAMQLEGRAESLQDGEIGQLVKVRMAGATSAVQARVVERGRVEATP